MNAAEQMIAAGESKKPLTVITDGDKAMANAIKIVLPDAHHRLCLWHLIRNVKSHTGSKPFCGGFMKCVECRTPEDFEIAWKELVEHHKVQENKWAIDLYEDKEKWAEAYMRGRFFAGMRSTQRCESMHRTLKRVLNKKIMLYRFVELYDLILGRLRYEEDGMDYDSTHRFPVIDGVLSKVKFEAAKVNKVSETLNTAPAASC